MDWLAGMNRAVAYLEENLKGEINLARAAEQVHCSVNHFQKIFAILCGVPLSEYIRCRRLSLAAHDLQDRDERVVDTALRYGYDSPTAFARAFSAMHGVPPSQARRQGARLKAYPPISFEVSIKGAVKMEYRLVELPAFRVVGARLATSSEQGRNVREIPAFWDHCRRSGVLGELERLGQYEGGPVKGLLGICGEQKAETDPSFAYYIAVASTLPCPEGLSEMELKAASYAVFETVGKLPDSLQELSARIFGQWLPASGYRLADTLDFELYPFDDGFAGEVSTGVWVPVIK